MKLIAVCCYFCGGNNGQLQGYFTMSDLGKSIIRFLGYLFALLVLGFTGFQTWSLLYEVSQNAVVASIGVVLFEGGMLFWWFSFQKDAEGIGQLAVSLLWAVFGLLLVGGATALHLGAVDGQTFGANTPAKLITLAAIVNLVGKFIYPLLEPATFNAVWQKALEGKVTRQAYKAADGQIDDMAGRLAEMIGQAHEMAQAILLRDAPPTEMFN
jgi:hypothetical protein